MNGLFVREEEGHWVEQMEELKGFVEGRRKILG